MKIAIAMVQVPFISGGAEIHATMLCDELKRRGHQADIVTIPFKWYPNEKIIDCMIMGRLMDLSEVNGEKIDVVIAMKFPAYYVKHECKVLWLLHQHRQAYDLWETPYGDIHLTEDGNRIRETIIKHDNMYISEAKDIFTNAKNTSNRLLKYNGIVSTPLYHPPQNHEKLHCDEYEDFIFYPSRIDKMKRQRVLVEAAKYIKTPTKILLAGSGSQNEIEYLRNYIRENDLGSRVKLLGFISEEEKIDYYARCLAVYFGAYDEDYGYITLEGFFSKKPVIVHRDAGGPLEFVVNEDNGFIIDTDARILAKKIEELSRDKIKAKKMGESGFRMLVAKNMNWDYVIEQLLRCVKEK